ncbi:hypothetical protein OKA05_27490 [Luteolibacter arcticus]|uniref:DUF1559 domain-containing protein n=1 Tax=Luteolibacter arcticus TaxID=1581411 RepID=A0ABT3GS22_9BACT|nr:hypothetical protein [Luteolibacter arcticus]MCW1926329.1 hypothetical protein [Luteolibacter arcticus]
MVPNLRFTTFLVTVGVVVVGNNRRQESYAWWIAGLAITSFVAMLLLATLQQRKKESYRTEVITHAKQLNLALIHFDNDYGSFPSNELAKEVPAFSGLTGPRVLEQLEAAGCVDDLDRLLGVSDDPGAKWYYFPGNAVPVGDPGRPVLIFPPVDDKVMIVGVDGSAKATSLSQMDLSGAVEIPATKKKR